MTTVVIGAGIAGLTAAIMARKAGEDVTVVTVGFGGLQLGQGTLDVFGAPHPLEAIAKLPAGHPYSVISEESLRAGCAAFMEIVPLRGSLEETTVLPTALGALRRTSFFPASMSAGKIDDGARYLLVGFSGLKDFYPLLAAENLRSQGIEARAEVLELVAPGDTSLPYSRMLADPAAAQSLGKRLGELAQDGERIGIAAVAREDAAARIEQAAGHPVFQIPTAPPSISGLQMNEKLRQACVEMRIRMFLNSKAVGAVSSGGRVTAVKVQVAGSVKELPADHVIYAGGGLDSGALLYDSYGELSDTVFSLPVVGAENPVHGDYLGERQPLFAAGLAVDAAMRPLDGDRPVYTNLHAVGGMLAGAQRAHEKSGEGIALGSAAQAVAAMQRSDA
jgi:glycerol-3-phosphate dehydrogenase subunit B